MSYIEEISWMSESGYSDIELLEYIDNHFAEIECEFNGEEYKEPKKHCSLFLYGLSIFHTFPATYHLALLMVCTFHSSLDMHNAAHTVMISDITTSAWLIHFCHKAI